MKNFTGYALAFITGVLLMLAVNGQKSNNTGTWQLAYAHSATGEPSKGSKTELINAVLAGKEVRVYWEGSYVKHATDAGFLTVIGDEVFAQIQEIKGQRPTETPPSVEIMADRKWSTIFSTNGDRALRWFVKG